MNQKNIEFASVGDLFTGSDVVICIPRGEPISVELEALRGCEEKKSRYTIETRIALRSFNTREFTIRTIWNRRKSPYMKREDHQVDFSLLSCENRQPLVSRKTYCTILYNLIKHNHCLIHAIAASSHPIMFGTTTWNPRRHRDACKEVERGWAPPPQRHGDTTLNFGNGPRGNNASFVVEVG